MNNRKFRDTIEYLEENYGRKEDEITIINSITKSNGDVIFPGKYKFRLGKWHKLIGCIWYPISFTMN